MLGKGLLKCHALSGAGGPTTIKFSTLYHSWFSLISYTSLLCWVLDRKTLQHTTCVCTTGLWEQAGMPRARISFRRNRIGFVSRKYFRDQAFSKTTQYQSQDKGAFEDFVRGC